MSRAIQKSHDGDESATSGFTAHRGSLSFGPLFLGFFGGTPFYYSNIIPFKEAFDRDLLDRSGHYFVQFGWYAPFHPNGNYTKMVQNIIGGGFTDFTMCLNSTVEYENAVNRFPGLVAKCCLSEHYFTVLRHDLASVFRNSGLSEDQRIYSAVMTARRAPIKNRDLAANVPELAAITSNHFENPEEDVPGAAFINDRLLDRTELNTLYGKSKTGLVLSFTEGANRATIEYLLAGLPVITPESVGGRHLHLDTGNSIIVPRIDDRDLMRSRICEAVEQMTRQIVSGEITRREIRDRTLARMHWSTEFLRHLIAKILEARDARLGDGELEEALCRHSTGTVEFLRHDPLPPRDPAPFEVWPVTWP